jgi:hypothetical protein
MNVADISKTAISSNASMMEIGTIAKNARIENKMNKLKFSHDYTKLPVKWDGTQAILIGVQHIEDMDQFKKRLPQLIRADTFFRGEEGSYPLKFKEGLLLTFFHLDTCQIFTTIRRFTDEKSEYYQDRELEIFELVRM